MSEETTQTGNEVATTSENAMDIAALCDHAKGLEPTGDELVTNYYDFTVGESIRLLAMGIKRIEKKNPTKEDWDNKREDEDKPMTNAVRFLNCNDGEFYITAAAVLVSSLVDVAKNNPTSEEKVFHEVVCLGEKESDKGKYQTFSIKPLK